MASADVCKDGTTPEAFKLVAIKSKNATVNHPDVAKIHTCRKVAKREEMAALRECEVEFEVCRSTRRVFAKKTEICHPIGPRVSAAYKIPRGNRILDSCKRRDNMAIQQRLPKRYIDKEKLGDVLRALFGSQGQPYVLEVSFTD